MSPSLLSLVVQDERVAKILENLRQSVKQNQPFHIAPDEIAHIQQKFYAGIEEGEKDLHELSFDVIKSFANLSDAKTTLIVWGRCPDIHHPAIVKSYTQIDLTQVMSSKYMDTMIAWTHSPVCKMCGEKTNTIASFNQYKFDQNFPSGLKVMLSRIKATSNVCYKIADMVFDIDRMFQRDKIENRYKQTLTDMYGLKLAFSTREQIEQSVEYFRNHPEIQFLDEKDYLGEHRKKSGYEAYKIVIQKNGQIFEIQLQTTKMLDTERSSLNASHKTYKEKQMEERRKLGDQYHNFYDILIQIFSSSKDRIDYKEI
ncbi:MAG: hypothetical protein R2877_05620 [Bdellovibrionota bacterium]